MVTVALDATPLLGRRTGIGVVLHGLVNALPKLPDLDEGPLDLVGYGLTGTGWRHLAGVMPGGRVARAPMPAAAMLRQWRHADWPPIEWWTGPVDLVHGTNFVVPPARRARRLVSVHDLTAVRFPQLCSPSSLRYPGLVQRAVDAGADVHTGAAAMVPEICEHFGLPGERVHVVGWGITPPAAVVHAPTHPAPLATPKQAGPPYLLGLGTVEPRKDFPLLVRAFDRLAGDHPDLELRIVGQPGWGEAALDGAIAGASVRRRIHRDGWVDQVDEVVAGAAVFVFPSVYEGFGLPPLEAMARGVPVVATAAGAVPEVVGPAADLVPVGDADALAAAISRVLDDDEHRRQLIEAGRARVAELTWPKAAAAMRNLYVRLAASD